MRLIIFAQRQNFSDLSILNSSPNICVISLRRLERAEVRFGEANRVPKMANRHTLKGFARVNQS